MLGIELQQTRVYQEAVAEGEARGKAEERRSLVVKILTRKLGSLSPQLQAQVNSLQIDSPKARLRQRVESLGEALLDFTSIADLENWLSHD